MRQGIFLIALLIYSIPALSQTLNKHHVQIKSACNLQKVVETTHQDNLGTHKVYSYQCVLNETDIEIYRLNVIMFEHTMSDAVMMDSYLSSLRQEYAQLGKVENTTLGGKKAVQVKENVIIEGHQLLQYSISTLHKNQSVTIVFVTDSNSTAKLDLYKKSVVLY